MNKILVIGNIGLKSKKNDGQTAKTKLYCKKIEDCGYDLIFVDIENFKLHPISILIKIKKAIKKCDRIVLLAARRGVRVLIPLINYINRKTHKPFILPMIGINILHKYIDKLSENDHYNFVNKNIFKIKPSKFDKKQYAKITYILAENTIVANCVSNFFEIKNVFILNNFRDFTAKRKKDKKNGSLKLIFLSRVTPNKGIFVLLDAVQSLINESKNVTLDIYGNKYFDESEEIKFNSYLNDKIKYFGNIDNKVVIETIQKYDLFIFPTLYKDEGTPGVIAESLLAGTPVISSNFAQSSSILVNNFDSIIYDSNLKDCLKNFINGKHDLDLFSKNATISGEKFSFDYNKALFLKYVCGEE